MKKGDPIQIREIHNGVMIEPLSLQGGMVAYKEIIAFQNMESFIENAESYPVPLVYNHKGHAILCFIDKNYDIRGVELVNVTG